MNKPGLWVLGLVAFALAVPPAAARGAVSDVPVAGKSLKLRASRTNPARRGIAFRSAAEAVIAAPFPDPTLGASLLVFASNAAGHCRAEIPLPAQYWRAIGDDGASRGWRYRDPTGSAGGIRTVVIKPRRTGGRIVVKGRGGGFPCGLGADAQSQPISVALRVADTRYCAAFGGTVKRNSVGRFRAVDAPAPTACPDNDLTVANLNVVHGLFCPPETDYCRIEDRIDLLGQWIVARGCPDVLAFQEVFDIPARSMAVLMQERLTDVCAFSFGVVYIRTNGVDDAFILSRYPALTSEIRLLHGPLRNALFTRVDHPIGPVDVFATHLAAGVDLGSSPCDTFDPCPPECVAEGDITVRECQAVQLAAFVEERHNVDTPAVIVGDFNAQPGTFVYNQFVGRGWADTTLASGNPECDPLTGIGCTSGREGNDLSELESTDLNVRSRIDYVFLVPPGPTSSCTGSLDSPSDDDGDGTATRLFAEESNPFAACGPLPAPICWVSDHSGVQADVNCD